jgi:hypothetical protein
VVTRLGTELGTRLGTDLSAGYVAPSALFGAANAWSASSVTGTTTTLTWVPVRGSVALAVGTGASGAPVANALLGGRLAVPFTGLSSYRGVIPSPGDAQTMLVVGTTTAVENGGFFALTNAGAPNTGSALIRESAGDVFVARRVAVSANSPAPATPPRAFIFLATFTTAGCSAYVNSRVATASAGASATFTQTKAHIGEGADGIVNMSGAIAEASVFGRVLSLEEIQATILALSAYYSIPVAM